MMRDYPTLQRAWCNRENGGKTEWYAASEKTMRARFRNCWRKTNQEIGRAVALQGSEVARDTYTHFLNHSPIWWPVRAG